MQNTLLYHFIILLHGNTKTTWLHPDQTYNPEKWRQSSRIADPAIMQDKHYRRIIKDIIVWGELPNTFPTKEPTEPKDDNFIFLRGKSQQVDKVLKPGE